ncbi:hypothetical protein X798_04545, partial [Onchocerca flexuosa]
LVRVTSPYVATTQLLPTVPALNPYTVFGNGLMASVPVKTDATAGEQQQQAINITMPWATVAGYDEKQGDFVQTLMNSQYAAAVHRLGGRQVSRKFENVDSSNDNDNDLINLSSNLIIFSIFPNHTAALVKPAKQDHMVNPTRISPVLLQQNARRFTPY